jgi:hypothetical protein
MNFELPKKDKKSTREIIEKGLQKELANELFQIDTILNQRKNMQLDSSEAYHRLYKKLITFDKHIAIRYDRMTGSTYLFKIAGQLMDSVISENDLNTFSEEVKKAIKLIANL